MTSTLSAASLEKPKPNHRSTWFKNTCTRGGLLLLVIDGAVVATISRVGIALGLLRNTSHRMLLSLIAADHDHNWPVREPEIQRLRLCTQLLCNLFSSASKAKIRNVTVCASQ